MLSFLPRGNGLLRPISAGATRKQERADVASCNEGKGHTSVWVSPYGITLLCVFAAIIGYSNFSI